MAAVTSSGRTQSLERGGAGQVLAGGGVPIVGGQDRAGGDGVYGHIRRQGARQGLGQHHHTGLAHRMRGVARPGLQAPDVRQVDDPAFRGPEPGQRPLGDEERRAQVEIKDPVPERRRGLVDGRRDHDPGRVDQHIEPAEVLGHPRRETARGFRLPEVRLERLGRTPERLDRGDRVAGTRGRAVIMHARPASPVHRERARSPGRVGVPRR